jgi:hypothetical protein
MVSKLQPFEDYAYIYIYIYIYKQIVKLTENVCRYIYISFVN